MRSMAWCPAFRNLLQGKKNKVSHPMSLGRNENKILFNIHCEEGDEIPESSLASAGPLKGASLTSWSVLQQEVQSLVSPSNHRSRHGGHALWNLCLPSWKCGAEIACLYFCGAVVEAAFRRSGASDLLLSCGSGAATKQDTEKTHTGYLNKRWK